MKKIFCAISILCLVLAGAFSGGKKDAVQSVKVGVLNGPSGIPCARLIENKEPLKGVPVEYENFAAANQLLPKLLSGEVDIGFLPPNVAAKVYTSNNKAVVAIGVSGNGMLSLITTDPKLSSLSDLKGKTVAVAGAGATPEYVFRYVLSQNKIKVGEGSDEVNLDFSIPNNELAAAVIGGKIDYAVVPEPFSTVALMQGANVRKAFDLQEEFAKVSGTKDYPMTLIVARSDFAKKNPALIKEFLAQFKDSLEWTLANPSQAGVSAENAGLGLKAVIVTKAIPTANFVYETPSFAKERVEALLSLFLSFAPDSIGGALPDKGFYF